MKTIDEILNKYSRTDEGNGFYDEDVYKAMEEYSSQFTPVEVTDEEIDNRFPINVTMIKPCNLSTRNKWIQQGIMWYRDQLASHHEKTPDLDCGKYEDEDYRKHGRKT